MHHDELGFIPQIQGGFNIWTLINVIHNTNRMKDTKYIIQRNEEKAFNKTFHD